MFSRYCNCNLVGGQGEDNMGKRKGGKGDAVEEAVKKASRVVLQVKDQLKLLPRPHSHQAK